MLDARLNTLFLGRKLFHFPQLPSTNSWLNENLSSNLPDGTAVITDYQTLGKGQRGSVWEVSAGLNLTFSFLLKPDFLEASAQFDLSRVVALGISDAIKSISNGSVSIKWPNDIYLNKLKLGGILIENHLRGSSINESIIGIGINVNQIDFPIHLTKATSLKRENTSNFDLFEVAAAVLNAIEVRYLQLKSGHIESIREEYQSSLLGINRKRWFEIDQQMVEAVVLGTTPEGLLHLSIEGESRFFNLKEVVWKG